MLFYKHLKRIGREVPGQNFAHLYSHVTKKPCVAVFKIQSYPAGIPSRDGGIPPGVPDWFGGIPPRIPGWFGGISPGILIGLIVSHSGSYCRWVWQDLIQDPRLVWQDLIQDPRQDWWDLPWDPTWDVP